MIGYFGKISERGDFVTFGLPAPVTGAWDRWLSGMLQEAVDVYGPDWPSIYENAPLWQFHLAPDCLRSPSGRLKRGLAGIMAPSSDQVGRSFPFMVGRVVGAKDIPGQAWFAQLARLMHLGRTGSFSAFHEAIKAAGVNPDAPSNAGRPSSSLMSPCSGWPYGQGLPAGMSLWAPMGVKPGILLCRQHMPKTADSALFFAQPGKIWAESCQLIEG
ncbi:MAG: type VI secretion system-associated protein TagF [Pseudomonadota bacterium]